MTVDICVRWNVIQVIVLHVKKLVFNPVIVEKLKKRDTATQKFFHVSKCVVKCFLVGIIIVKKYVIQDLVGLALEKGRGPVFVEKMVLV